MNITLKRVLWTGMLSLFFISPNISSLFGQHKLQIRPPNSFSPVDFSGCTVESKANFLIKVKSPNGDPVPNTEVKIKVNGVNNSFKILTTDQNGAANFNYTGYDTGLDRIIAWTDQTPKRKVAFKTWVPCPFADEDCDGVMNKDDLCHGGDDNIDNNDDDLADCAVYPLWEDLDESWKCGEGRVLMCLPLRFSNDPITICIKNQFINKVLNIGGFLGPCDGATCNGANMVFEDDIDAKAIELINQSSPYYLSTEGDFYIKADPAFKLIEADKIQLSKEVYVYPNPARAFISLDLVNMEDSNPTISILDISGKQVFNSNFKNLTASKISLLDLGIEPGAYILQVIHNEGILTKSFIVSGE